MTGAHQRSIVSHPFVPTAVEAPCFTSCLGVLAKQRFPFNGVGPVPVDEKPYKKSSCFRRIIGLGKLMNAVFSALSGSGMDRVPHSGDSCNVADIASFLGTCTPASDSVPRLAVECRPTPCCQRVSGPVAEIR